jgi:hypothetical protein
MISNPGDNRTALIAALIAIPAAVVVSMAIHTFVPGQEKPSVTVIAGAEAPQGEKMSRPFRGAHGHHAPGKEMPGRKFSKEEFKKRFMAIRAERMNTLKKIVELSKKRMELLAKQQGACPKAVIESVRDYLLAESAMHCQNARIRFEGASVSELAVKAVAAENIAAACQKKAANKVDAETAALKSQIEALNLKLELCRQRMVYNPKWKAAFEAFKKAQTVANLQAMLDAEREAMPPRRPRGK